jgi:DNA-binding MarR family transcriptional regulator
MKRRQDNSVSGASDTTTGMSEFAKIHAQLVKDIGVHGGGGGANGSGGLGGTPGETSAQGIFFAGLPRGIAHHKHLIEPLREIGSQLPFSKAALHTLAVIVDMSPAGPWSRGRNDDRPIVVASNYEIADRRGLCIRTVQVHIKELASAGAIARRMGPSGHRRLVRRPDGSEDRYGIDLAPLVPFYFRAKKMAASARQHRAGMKEGRRDITVVASQMTQMREMGKSLGDMAPKRAVADIAVPEPVSESALAAVDLDRRIGTILTKARGLIERDSHAPSGTRVVNLAQMQELVALSEALLEDLRRAVWTGHAVMPGDSWEPDVCASIAHGINILGIDKSNTTAKKDSSMDESRFTLVPTNGLSPSKEGYGRATITIWPAGNVSPSDQTEMNLSDTQPGQPSSNAKAKSDAQAPAAKTANADMKAAAHASLPPINLSVERLLTIDPRMAEMIKISSGGDVVRIEDARSHHLFDLARYMVIEEFGGTQKIWGEMAKRRGVGVATLAAIITLIKPDHELKNGNRMAYWLGILRKPTPEINLVPSIFAAERRVRERDRY